MRERERLVDFRGGYVSCRGCNRLILFAPAELLQVICCGLLYSPEYGPLDLVVYDRLEAGEGAEAQLIPPVVYEVGHAPDEDPPDEPMPVPAPAPEPAPDEADADEDADEEEAEVAGMAVSVATTAARRWERDQQVRRQRGPERFYQSEG